VSVVNPGYDFFRTQRGTQFRFQLPFAIPADFFEPGSEPVIDQVVEFRGVPIGLFKGVDVGTADTVIKREQPATLADSLPSSDTIPISIAKLSMRSVRPLRVLVRRREQHWNLEVSESAVTPSRGTMTITKETPEGGVFGSGLVVVPRFRFVRRRDGAERFLDVGAIGFPDDVLREHLTLTADRVPWVVHAPPGVLVVPDMNEGFAASASSAGKVASIEAAPLARHGIRPAQPKHGRTPTGPGSCPCTVQTRPHDDPVVLDIDRIDAASLLGISGPLPYLVLRSEALWQRAIWVTTERAGHVTNQEQLTVENNDFTYSWRVDAFTNAAHPSAYFGPAVPVAQPGRGLPVSLIGSLDPFGLECRPGALANGECLVVRFDLERLYTDQVATGALTGKLDDLEIVITCTATSRTGAASASGTVRIVATGQPPGAPSPPYVGLPDWDVLTIDPGWDTGDRYVVGVNVPDDTLPTRPYPEMEVFWGTEDDCDPASTFRTTKFTMDEPVTSLSSRTITVGELLPIEVQGVYRADWDVHLEHPDCPQSFGQLEQDTRPPVIWSITNTGGATEVVRETEPLANSALVYVPELATDIRFRVVASSTVPGGVIDVGGQAVSLPDQHASHEFDFMAHPLLLRLALKDLEGQPLAHRRCALILPSGAVRTLASDAAGLLQHPIAADLIAAQLHVYEVQGDPPATEPVLDLAISIGDLHMPTTTAGSRSRLNNLGLDAGPETPGAYDGALHTRSLQRFETSRRLFTGGLRNRPNVSGTLDTQTSDALAASHDV